MNEKSTARNSTVRKPYATIIAVVVVTAYYLMNGGSVQTPSSVDQSSTTAGLQTEVFADGAMIESVGVVDRILPDDTEGSRHQRFILKLDSGQTLLVAHNIDLAPRIDELERGDKVKFHGQYESNNSGGVVHWTHHDPRGEHPAGWLEHEGRRFE
jgi:hypothetical protein